jgi:hypothetical protein
MPTHLSVSPFTSYTADPFGISLLSVRCWEHARRANFPCLSRSRSSTDETRYSLGDPLVDSYLEFVAGRARPNTLRSVAFDLKSFLVGHLNALIGAIDQFLIRGTGSRKDRRGKPRR